MACVGDRADRFSQADSVLEDLFADVRTDRVFRDYIDVAAEQISEILFDRDDVEEGSAWF